ncbi:MAG: hypothetical protein ACOC7U_03525 [Spirochaetota bacterium]
MSKKGDEISFFDEQEYADTVGRYLSKQLKTLKRSYTDGEVGIFIGTHDTGGRKGIKYIFGSNASSNFKERVCEAAMDIILNDAGVDFSVSSEDNEYPSP